MNRKEVRKYNNCMTKYRQQNINNLHAAIYYIRNMPLENNQIILHNKYAIFSYLGVLRRVFSMNSKTKK